MFAPPFPAYCAATRATISSVAFSPVGKLMLTTTGSVLNGGYVIGEARVWDAGRGATGGVLVASAPSIVSAALSPDGKLIATTNGDGAVRI